MDSENVAKYIALLSQLKIDVASNVVYCCSNKWEIHCGTHKLNVSVANILEHGFRFLKDNGKPDLWVFVQGLSWLQPNLAASPSFFGPTRLKSQRISARHVDKAISWLHSSIQSRTIFEKLSWLLSDNEHLASCYHTTAFLRQPKYSEGFLICLQAWDNNQISLLTKLDPDLFSNDKLLKKHRRCLSFPETDAVSGKIWMFAKRPEKMHDEISIVFPHQLEIGAVENEHSPLYKTAAVAKIRDRLINSIFESSDYEEDIKMQLKQKYRKRCFSSSDVYFLSVDRFMNLPITSFLRRPTWLSSTDFVSAQSRKCTSSIDIRKVLSVRYNVLNVNRHEKPHSDVKIVEHQNIEANSKNSSCKNRRPRKRASFFRTPAGYKKDVDKTDSSCSEDADTLVHTNACIVPNTRKSLIDNNENITLPLCTGSFPRPSPGQSIISFLTSGVFTQMNAELDRENAHFHISEAIIATLEQMKFNQQIQQFDDLIDDSDEEINRLKRIIQLKRKQKEHIKRVSIPNWSENTDSAATTTDQSVHSLSSSIYSTSDSISTDQEAGESSRIGNNLSVSTLSLFSDEANERESDISASAENVAISLLKRFKENQLPAASEIEWLVSERDAPQQILPLPNSIPVDPSEQNGKFTLLRGTPEWAPPRPQIIFTFHPTRSRKTILAKQANCCAGCGMFVAPKYVSKFRYCEYLGRYFCPSCHNEQTSIIPGKILQKWDFSRYPVSNFSSRLLEQMHTDPLFNVVDLNSDLYHRVSSLQKVRLLRISLFYLKDFIFTCKYAERYRKIMMDEPTHIINDPDVYSMEDFVNVKSGGMYKTLNSIVKSCDMHVNNCTLCQARAFICEICNKQESIFPWQLSRVVRCEKCGSCHHIKCYKHKMTCPKCFRINNRNDLNKIEGSEMCS